MFVRPPLVPSLILALGVLASGCSGDDAECSRGSPCEQGAVCIAGACVGADASVVLSDGGGGDGSAPDAAATDAQATDGGAADAAEDGGAADAAEDGGLEDAAEDGGLEDARARDADVQDADPADATAPDVGPLDVGPADSGAPDSGAPDATPLDGGAPDTGVDAGPPLDAGVGPPAPVTCSGLNPGTEGCPCTSTLGPNDTAFLQDDCQSSMLCVPFDLLSGNQQLTGPVQSCVRPCTVDADCGAGRRCVDSGFDVTSGAPRICVDRVADYDEFCGFSRAQISRLPGAVIETPDEQVGCASGLECTLGVFSDIHPDEGVCLDFCMSNLDCAAPTPYCNPAAFTTTSSTGQPTPLGVCSTGQYGQGSLCGDPDPDKLGLASGCDTSTTTPVNTTCVPVGGLLPSGRGICMTPCDTGAIYGPCTGVEPDGTAQTCSGGFFTGGVGVCNAGCSNYPGDCSGPGEFGLGRFCMDYLSDAAGNPVGLCMDRRPPVLTPAEFDAMGNLAQMGSNCFPVGGTERFTQCPAPGHCEIVDIQAGIGLCVMGCGPTNTPTSNQYCDGALSITTGLCASVFTQGGQPVTTRGLCADTAP